MATPSPARARAASPASPRAVPTSSLRPDGDGTILRYDVKAQVGGKLAQIGGRLIDATAKQMADQFFKAFAANVAAAGRRRRAGAARRR